MKATLKLADHSVLPGEKVIEIWWKDQSGLERMIGIVTGADGPGVRIVSKYLLSVQDLSQGVRSIYELKAGE